MIPWAQTQMPVINFVILGKVAEGEIGKAMSSMPIIVERSFAALGKGGDPPPPLQCVILPQSPLVLHTLLLLAWISRVSAIDHS